MSLALRIRYPLGEELIQMRYLCLSPTLKKMGVLANSSIRIKLVYLETIIFFMVKEIIRVNITIIDIKNMYLFFIIFST